MMMSKRIITNDSERCVGCNRCIRACPVEEANIAYESDSKILVKVDDKKCIACGACISVCPHGSRSYEDDTQRFFDDLKSGVKISLFAAPAFKTNFREWEQILTWFRQLGVDKLYDVSLGADICSWAYIRYLQKNPGKNLITQPCPAIVNYILKYRNNLLSKLSPVQSPMLCMAVYMRKYEKIGTKIAAVSPCIAKSHEFEDTGLVEYNVTFNNLIKYIRDNNISLPVQAGRFDNYEPGLGFLYPMPGGLKENVEYYMGKGIQVDKSEGQRTVYRALYEYGEQPPGHLPDVFDVLNCAEGCNHGTGCLPDHENAGIFGINKTLHKARMKSLSGDGKQHLEKLYETFDKTLKIEDFMRKYTPAPVSETKVTDRDIEAAFERLNKSDFAERNFNCGACGSETCEGMAKKIVKGVNIVSNCINRTHKNLEREHTELSGISEYFGSVLNDMTDIKSSIEEIVNSMGEVTSSIENYGNIIAGIQKISSQINMISLNASIEAVRAGQYGASFGAVAEEIRKLANSSKTSADNSNRISANAASAVNSITGKIVKINENIHEAYDDISEISATTMKIIHRE
jgi:iron only hydrogenase large subunit-like protein